jgi:hypothetical protein
MTRRTATRALLRDRSINFCKLRTRLKSPSRDAAKIRCLSRRTLSSWVRHAMASQSVVSPSGPFTPTFVIVSNLPFGSGALASTSSQAHPTRVSALSGRGSFPYPASYP